MDLDHGTDTITADVTTDPIRIGGVAGLKVPTGTTAERIAEDGIFRKNSTTGKMEFYDGSNWIDIASNADLLDLQLNTQGFLLVDFALGNTYTMTAEESKYSCMAVFNHVGASTLTLHDSVDNPVIYNIIICGPDPIDFNCCSDSISLDMLGDNAYRVGYGFGLGAALTITTPSSEVTLNPDNSSGNLGSISAVANVNSALWRLQNNISLFKKYNEIVTVDMLGDDYTMTAEESLHSTIVVTNVGDGTKTLKLYDSPNNPPKYDVLVYDVYDVTFSNVDLTFNTLLRSARVEKFNYTYGVGGLGDKRAYNGSVVGVTFDNGGSDITAGMKGFIRVNKAGTINGWNIVADAVGSIVIDVWKKYSAVPDVTDSIPGTGTKPYLSSVQYDSDNTNSWDGTPTKEIRPGDIFGFNVVSCTGIKRATLTIDFDY